MSSTSDASPLVTANKPTSLAVERPFTSITPGWTTPSGSTEYGVIYKDQVNEKSPSWIPAADLTPSERENVESNPIKVHRPRTQTVTMVKT